MCWLAWHQPDFTIVTISPLLYHRMRLFRIRTLTHFCTVITCKVLFKWCMCLNKFILITENSQHLYFCRIMNCAPDVCILILADDTFVWLTTMNRMWACGRRMCRKAREMSKLHAILLRCEEKALKYAEIIMILSKVIRYSIERDWLNIHSSEHMKRERRKRMVEYNNTYTHI